MMRTLMIASFFVVFLAACEAGQSTTTETAPAASSGAAEPAEPTEPAEPAKPAAEPDERMVNAVKSRKAVLLVLKDNFVPLALTAMGRIDYDADKAQRYADRLPVMIGMMEERFATDTRGSGVETEALDVIWEDMDAFKGKIADAMEAANKLAALASDEAQFKEAAMGMRSACGSCHDDFRVEQD